MIENIEGKDIEHRFLIIKSWNEWGEGNHLEPDLKYEKKYLEALKFELYRSSSQATALDLTQQ